MGQIDIQKIKEKAESYFYLGEYDKAMHNFSLALMENPEDRELQLYAVLTDMAMENEEKAQAIFEYYQITKEIQEEGAEEIIEGLIESMDFDIELLNRLIQGSYFDEEIVDENSIRYSDFILHINERGSFKRAYEDIMLGTKVLINSKDDFIDFLDKLVENDYIESAFSYAEAAISIFPKDIKLQSIFKKIKEKSKTNNDSKI